MLVYSDLVRRVVADIAATVPGLGHLQPDRIAIAAAARWAGTKWGNLATCMGLRVDGEPGFAVWTRGRSRKVLEVSPWYRHVAARVTRGGVECRYLILLRLPRLLKHDPLETIVHELFHIGVEGDGRLRPMRHGRLFDWNVRRLMREWIERGDPELVELARLDLARLQRRHGRVLARRLPGNFRPVLTEPAEPPMSYEEGVALHYPRYRLAEGYSMRAMRLTSARTPRAIELDDCRLRLYHARGSEDLAPSLARYVAYRAAGPAP